MKSEVIMSGNAFYCLLRAIPIADECCYRWHHRSEVNMAERYVQAREEWMSRGLGELDFDGQLHPTVSLARILYELSDILAVSLWKRESASEYLYFVRGKVGLCRILVHEDEARLRTAQAKEYIYWLRQLYKERVPGELFTQRIPAVRKDSRTDKIDEESAPQVYMDHIDMMFGGGTDA